MSLIAPPFDWFKWLQYNWYSVEGSEKLQQLVGPLPSYIPDIFQLGCTARIVNGQDVLCLSTTGDGKSALIYLAAIAQKGTITLVVCPTNFLKSNLVFLIQIYHVIYLSHVELQVLSLQNTSVPAQAINAETQTCWLWHLGCGKNRNVPSSFV